MAKGQAMRAILLRKRRQLFEGVCLKASCGV